MASLAKNQESAEFLDGLKDSLEKFIEIQEKGDQQLEDIINHDEIGIFHKYDFYLLTYINMYPQYLSFVIEKPTRFLDYVTNGLMNFQDKYYSLDPSKTALFKEFLIVNFKEIPYTHQVYRFLDKSADRDSSNSTDSALFLECKSLFYKLIMMQGVILKVSQPKSMEKYRVYSCATCNRGYLEENNWVLGKNRLKQSKIPSFVRNAATDDEHSDKYTGFLKNEKLKCICDSKRLTQREKVLITYQEIDIRLNYLNRLTVLFEGNINENFKLGQKICVTGFLISNFDKLVKHSRCEGTISLYALKHDLVSDAQQTVLSQDVLIDSFLQPPESIKNDIATKNRLIRAFCPKIKKKHFAKLFMLLALVSGTSYKRNSGEVRSQIHMLFVGPSGSHKFDLMRAASSILKESKYIPLSENLGNDFVFTMSKKQDTINFEAGAFLMGNKDVTFMHDINLIHSKNKELLNDILFNQKIKKYFENANYEISVKTSIIASCEPLVRVKAKERANADIASTCGVSESLLNLFDAVVNLDNGNNDEEVDYQINHLLKYFTDKPPFAKKGDDEDGGPQPKGAKKEKEALTEDELRTYIDDCRKIIVKVSQRTYPLINSYLQAINASYSSGEFERIVRFVQAHAKLLGRSLATIYDVMSVIALFEANECRGLVEGAKDKILVKSMDEYRKLEGQILGKLELGR